MIVNLKDPKSLKAVEYIRALRSDATTVSVGRLLWQAVTETGYKQVLLDEAINGPEQAANIGYLNQFFDSLRNYESIAGMATVPNYLLSLPALMAAGESVDDDTLEINENQVIVTTIHKAKGLEWDTVYIPKLTAQTFPLNKQAQGRMGGTIPSCENTDECGSIFHSCIISHLSALELS